MENFASFKVRYFDNPELVEIQDTIFDLVQHLLFWHYSDCFDFSQNAKAAATPTKLLFGDTVTYFPCQFNKSKDECSIEELMAICKRIAEVVLGRIEADLQTQLQRFDIPDTVTATHQFDTLPFLHDPNKIKLVGVTWREAGPSILVKAKQKKLGNLMFSHGKCTESERGNLVFEMNIAVKLYETVFEC